MTTDNPVDVSVEELQAQRLLDKKMIADLKTQVDELTKSLKTSNDLIEGDTKSKLIAELDLTTDYELKELVSMDSGRLKQIRDDQKRYKPPRKLAPGVDMSEVAADKDAWKKDVYGKYERRNET